MDSFVILAYASSAASRTLLIQKIYSVGANKKKWFLWTMAAAQGAENDGDE